MVQGSNLKESRRLTRNLISELNRRKGEILSGPKSRLDTSPALQGELQNINSRIVRETSELNQLDRRAREERVVRGSTGQLLKNRGLGVPANRTSAVLTKDVELVGKASSGARFQKIGTQPNPFDKQVEVDRIRTATASPIPIEQDVSLSRVDRAVPAKAQAPRSQQDVSQRFSSRVAQRIAGARANPISIEEDVSLQRITRGRPSKEDLEARDAQLRDVTRASSSRRIEELFGIPTGIRKGVKLPKSVDILDSSIVPNPVRSSGTQSVFTVLSGPKEGQLLSVERQETQSPSRQEGTVKLTGIDAAKQSRVPGIAFVTRNIIEPVVKRTDKAQSALESNVEKLRKSSERVTVQQRRLNELQRARSGSQDSLFPVGKPTDPRSVKRATQQAGLAVIGGTALAASFFINPVTSTVKAGRALLEQPGAVAKGFASQFIASPSFTIGTIATEVALTGVAAKGLSSAATRLPIRAGRVASIEEGVIIRGVKPAESFDVTQSVVNVEVGGRFFEGIGQQRLRVASLTDDVSSGVLDAQVQVREVAPRVTAKAPTRPSSDVPRFRITTALDDTAQPFKLSPTVRTPTVLFDTFDFRGLRADIRSIQPRTAVLRGSSATAPSEPLAINAGTSQNILATPAGSATSSSSLDSFIEGTKQQPSSVVAKSVSQVQKEIPNLGFQPKPPSFGPGVEIKGRGIVRTVRTDKGVQTFGDLNLVSQTGKRREVSSFVIRQDVADLLVDQFGVTRTGQTFLLETTRKSVGKTQSFGTPGRRVVGGRVSQVATVERPREALRLITNDFGVQELDVKSVSVSGGKSVRNAIKNQLLQDPLFTGRNTQSGSSIDPNVELKPITFRDVSRRSEAGTRSIINLFESQQPRIQKNVRDAFIRDLSGAAKRSSTSAKPSVTETVGIDLGRIEQRVILRNQRRGLSPLDFDQPISPTSIGDPLTVEATIKGARNIIRAERGARASRFVQGFSRLNPFIVGVQGLGLSRTDRAASNTAGTQQFRAASAQRSGQFTQSFFSQIPGIRQLGSQRQSPFQSIRQAFRQTPVSLTRQTPVQVPARTGVPTAPGIPTPGIPPFVPFIPGLPFIPTGGRGSNKKSKKVGKQPKAFIPSLTAQVVGGTFKNVNTKDITGLSVRPIPTGSVFSRFS